MKIQFAVLKKALITIGIFSSLSAIAWEPPKLGNPYPTKLGEAWGGQYAPDIDDPPTTDTLPMSPKRAAKYNFGLAARFQIPQIEFGYKSYRYLLDHGIEPKDSWAKQTLGVVGLSLGYEYGVEPAFDKGGNFIRTDRYFVSPQFEGKTVLKHFSRGAAVLSAVPGYDIEMTFTRQMSDPKAALLSVPYFHRNLPYNAKHALQGLNEQDLFTFKGDLHILSPLSYLTYLSDAHPIDGGAGFYYLISGTFKVYVLRLPENRVQLKVVAVRGKTKGLRANVGYNADLKILGSEFLGDQALKLVDLDIFNVDLSRKNDQAVITDYILKLDDPEVAAAYDKALSQIREFNYTKMADPLISNSKISVDVVSNLLAIEKIWEADSAAHSGSGRVVKVIDGGDASSPIDFKFKLGDTLAKFLPVSRSSSDDVTAIDNHGAKKQYVFDFSDRQIDFSLFFNLRQWKRDSIFGIISEADENFKNLNPLAFVMSMEVDRETSAFRAADLDGVKKGLAALFPQYQSQIKFPLLAKNDQLHNASVRTQIIVTADALNSVASVKSQVLSKSLEGYLKKYDSQINAVQEADSIKYVAGGISKALSPGLSMIDRMNLFKKLRNNPLFRQVGPGFLMSLMPQDQLDKLVRVDMALSSTESSSGPGQMVKFSSGPSGPANLYLKLFVSESDTNDDDLDVRNIRLEKELVQ